MLPVRRLGMLVAVILLSALTVPFPAATATAGAPVSALHFDAIPRIGGNWPGDPTGAMGETSIITAVNTSVAVYDLAGTAVLGPISFQAFGSFPSGTQVFD
ncbi:MAG TPA: hypothetical protein VJ259_00285, partial [Actinomycetota bacterium]|nr:hypothetical protein [Actinomycetota bacterium]